MNLENHQWQSLYRFGLTLCDSADEALALLNDSIERLLRVKPTHAMEPETYLRKVMRNLHATRYRQRNIPSAPVTIEHENLINSNHELVEATNLDDVRITSDALSIQWCNLSPEQKHILYLWAWLEFTPKESANELHLSALAYQKKVFQLKDQLSINNTCETNVSTAP